jgi:hypothetical protein
MSFQKFLNRIVDDSTWIKLDDLTSKVSKTYRKKYCWDKKNEVIAVYSELVEFEPRIIINNIFRTIDMKKYKWDTKILEVLFDQKLEFEDVNYCVFNGIKFKPCQSKQTIATYTVHKKNTKLPKRNKITIEISRNKKNPNLEYTNRLRVEREYYDLTPFSVHIIELIDLIEKRYKLIKKQGKNTEKERMKMWDLYSNHLHYK